MKLLHMSTDSLFEQLPTPQGPTVRISFDGVDYQVPAGSNLAAALLLTGVRRFRSTPVTAAPRAPFCMMGVCFECLVEVDGMPNSQSCLQTVQDGMVVRPQQGARQVRQAVDDDAQAAQLRQE
ncbi:(2Fe-2S)-binding protein [Paraburkholderia caballeronis]|uniref:(2Fe-2S)-binding protein n=1 Tax=Paraburkholderia caballeronis TaxID=416943 RepID=UPI001FB94A98|nr:(2Fe-2S)-binding protein [Paraburkholderia caballeronis]